MQYKGFYANVECNEGTTLYGYVVGFRESMIFQGETVAEITKCFHDSVDAYLKTFKDKK